MCAASHTAAQAAAPAIAQCCAASLDSLVVVAASPASATALAAAAASALATLHQCDAVLSSAIPATTLATSAAVALTKYGTGQASFPPHTFLTPTRPTHIQARHQSQRCAAAPRQACHHSPACLRAASTRHPNASMVLHCLAPSPACYCSAHHRSVCNSYSHSYSYSHSCSHSYSYS